MAKRKPTPKPNPIKPKPHTAFQEINQFAWKTQATLTRSEIACWLSLWTHTFRETGLARVSLTLAAKDAGCTQRAAQTAIASLIEKGLVRRVSKGSNLTHEASTYRVFAVASKEVDFPSPTPENMNALRELGRDE